MHSAPEEWLRLPAGGRHRDPQWEHRPRSPRCPPPVPFCRQRGCNVIVLPQGEPWIGANTIDQKLDKRTRQHKLKEHSGRTMDRNDRRHRRACHRRRAAKVSTAEMENTLTSKGTDPSDSHWRVGRSASAEKRGKTVRNEMPRHAHAQGDTHRTKGGWGDGCGWGRQQGLIQT